VHHRYITDNQTLTSTGFEADNGFCPFCHLFYATLGFILTQIQAALLGLLDETRSVTLTVEDRIAQAASAFGKETFSRKDYQNVLKGISTATASRDLSYGVNAGLLKRMGDRRTAVYHFTARI